MRAGNEETAHYLVDPWAAERAFETAEPPELMTEEVLAFFENTVAARAMATRPPTRVVTALEVVFIS
jgi:hypothetical protein